MQQFEALRDRVSANARWFRIGLVSTTVVAPLIARWNELRSANAAAMRDNVRASMRGAADSRLGDARALVVKVRNAAPIKQALPPPEEVRARATKRNEAISTQLWLIGVGVGLLAAGATAYFLAQRRLAANAEEPLYELPADSADGYDANMSGASGASRSAAQANGARAAAPSTSGATLTMGRAAQAPTIPGASGSYEPADIVEPGIPEPLVTSTPDEIAAALHPEAARFVGNIHTMVYHDSADDDHLPAEENRVYFASEEEAHAAGYRRDRQEVPQSEAGVGTAEGPTA